MFDQRELHAPYPGLRSFDASEVPVFFGREAHVSRLIDALYRRRFLAVVGPSGSGKSSLVRAGLLPALSLAWPGDVSDWRIAVMRPGERPLRRLADALIRPGVLGMELGVTGSDPRQAASIEAEIRARPEALVEQVEDALRGRGRRLPINLIVLVDQFEELFRYAELGERQAGEAEVFVERLLAPALSSKAAAGRVFVALTMRTDALHDCSRFLDLPEAINGAQYLVPRLKPAEMRRAIVGPAKVFEGYVDEDVVEALVTRPQRSEDELPQVQHVLSRMWARAFQRDARHPRVTIADLEACGGVESALSLHANGIFESLTREQRKLADGLFRAVTGLPEGAQSDTRRPQRVDQILSSTGLAPTDTHKLAPILRSFASEGANFLSFREPLNPETVVDISHEALIRQWQRLRSLVAWEATQAAEFKRWRERAEAHGRGDGELLSGADLLAAETWLAGKTRPRSGEGAADQGGQEDTVEAIQAGWVPHTGWAQRYARDVPGPGAVRELEDLRAFVALSRDHAEAARRKAYEARDTEERLKLEAARARADAAERERALADEGRQRLRQWVVIAAVVAAVAVAAAVAALLFGFKATRAELRAQSALASMQSQRLAKAVSSAVYGDTTAFAETKESIGGLTRFVRSFGTDGMAQAGDMQNTVAKLQPLVDRAEKNAAIVLGQQKALTQVSEALRAINRQSADLLEAAETVSSMKLQAGASAAELSAVTQLVMLTQRIGKSANEFLTTEGVSAEAVFQLGKDLNAFREIAQGVLDGSADLRLPGTKDPLTRQKLQQLMEQSEQTRKEASAILGNLQGLVNARTARAAIVADSEPLRNELEALGEAADGTWLWAAVAMLFGVLLLGGWLIRSATKSGALKRTSS